MEISISTGLYYKKSYKEILQIIAEAGGKYIELFLNDAFWEINSDVLIREVENRCLKISSIHTPLPAIADRSGISEEGWILKAQDIAKYVGASVIVTHILSKENNGRFISLDDDHKKNIVKFNLNNDGIYYTTENHSYLRYPSFTQEPDAMYQFLEETNTYLTFDTTHYAPEGNILEGYSKFSKFVKNIHLSDYDFKKKIDHLPIGDGNLPIEEFMGLLKRSKYEGFVTLEYDFDTSKRCLYHSIDEQINVIRKSIRTIEALL